MTDIDLACKEIKKQLDSCKMACGRERRMEIAYHLFDDFENKHYDLFIKRSEYLFLSTVYHKLLEFSEYNGPAEHNNEHFLARRFNKLKIKLETDIREELQKRAYRIYEKTGNTDAHENWIQAKNEMKNEGIKRLDMF